MRAYEPYGTMKETVEKFYKNLELKYGEEVWKPLKGYETTYEISNYSRVRYIKNKKLKAIRCGSSHYFELVLNKNGEKEHHSLPYYTLITFVSDRPSSNTQIHHKDGNMFNNHISNIQWVSPKKHFHLHFWKKKKLMNNRKLSISQYSHNGELIERYESAGQCASALGITRSCVDRYVNDKMKNRYWKLVAD